MFGLERLGRRVEDYFAARAVVGCHRGAALLGIPDADLAEQVRAAIDGEKGAGAAVEAIAAPPTAPAVEDKPRPGRARAKA